MAESRAFRWILYGVAVPAGVVGTAVLLALTTLSTGWPVHEAKALDFIFRASCRSDCDLEEEPDCRERCDCFADELRRGRSDDEYAALIQREDETEKELLFEEIAELCLDPAEPEAPDGALAE